ncbi:hypothetical protein XH87_09465 [Bradyrhizobium sp. CCBAU 53415]|nr:hypothetical protein [Bradyrhizobium sp. CCBAU 53415]
MIGWDDDEASQLPSAVSNARLEMSGPLAITARRQTTDVDATIADLRSCEHPHDMEACDMLLHIPLACCRYA